MVMVHVDIDDEHRHYDDAEHEHDQLPSVEEAKVMAGYYNTNNDSSRRRIVKILLGASFLGMIAIVILVVMVRKLHHLQEQPGVELPPQQQQHPASTLKLTTPTPTAHFSPEKMQFAIDYAGAPQNINVQFSDASSIQVRALRQVQTRRDLTLATHVVQLYALWCLRFATEGVRTDVTDEEYGMEEVPNWSHSWKEHDWCSWQGVTCDKKKNIVALQLANFHLTGALPKEVKLLSHLTELTVTNNKGLGEGGVPTWLAHMTSLQTVDIRGCPYIHGANALCKAMTDVAKTDLTMYADCPEIILCDCCICNKRDE